MTPVPCPKPGCDWSVDSATVPAGTVVTCPKCGQRFRLAAATPPTAGPGPARRFPSALLIAGGAVLAVGAVAGVIVAAALLRRDGGVTARPPAADFRDPDRNFAFAPPPAPWAGDPGLRNELGVNVAAYTRPAADGVPAASAALAVKDFGNRTPLTSELRDIMTAALGRVFLNLPAEPPLEPATWAGRPASVWRFRGEHRTTGVVSAGEAVALTHKGVGYWFYAWAAERDFDPAVAATVRDGFRLLVGRGDWSPTAASEVPFSGRKVGYRLTAFERIWDALPAGTDPAAPDLELRGVLKGRGRRDFPPRAEVRVWQRADPGDPVAVADAVVRRENTRDPEAFGPTAFVELTDPPAGDAPPGPDGPPPTPVRRLKVSWGAADGGGTARLLAVAGARVGGAVVVAEGSCPWDEREVWERRLVQLVGSLR